MEKKKILTYAAVFTASFGITLLVIGNFDHYESYQGRESLNYDMDRDGIPDLNVDLPAGTDLDFNEDGTYEFIGGDKIADVNIDLDGDGVADINIDTGGDGIPDLNIDLTGDGIPDYMIDRDGDGIADENLDIDIFIPKPEEPKEPEKPEGLPDNGGNDQFVKVPEIEGSDIDPSKLPKEDPNPAFADTKKNVEDFGLSNLKDHLGRFDFVCTTDSDVCTKTDDEGQFVYEYHINDNELFVTYRMTLDGTYAYQYVDLTTGQGVVTDQSEERYCVSNSADKTYNCWHAISNNGGYEKAANGDLFYNGNKIMESILPFLPHALKDFYS